MANGPQTQALHARAQPAPSLVARRVDLPCNLVGFQPPPCKVHLKFFPVGERWTLLTLTDPGMATKVARWLQQFGPSTTNIAPGIAPKIVRASFEKLPEAWQHMMSAVIVHYVQLTPEGAASLFVEDSPDRVERFVSSLRSGTPEVRHREILAGAGRVKLTARQLEVLSLAVALGYYETPHKLTLRALAKKLGLSVGAVSELLRRGEALVITNYVDSLSESRWSDANEPA